MHSQCTGSLAQDLRLAVDVDEFLGCITTAPYVMVENKFLFSLSNVLF